MTPPKSFILQKFTIIALLLLCQVVIALGQGGPAGIGTSSENVLWLRSDRGTSTTVNEGSVNQWQDISGNDNHANQPTLAKRPTYATSSINGFPALRFTGNNVNLVVNDNDNLDNTTGFTLFVVAQPDNIDEKPRGLLSKRVGPGNQAAYSFFSYTGSNLYLDAPTRMNGTTPADNTPQIFAAVFNGNDPDFRSRIFQNGSQTGWANAGSNTSIGNMASDLFIGILNDSYGNAFRGDMSEVIIYRSALNRAQRTIVEVYLANRYNIALTSYSFGSTTFNQNLIGIGNVGGDKSTSTHDVGSGLQLAESNGSLNTDGELVFAGHDGTAHGIDNSDLPDITPITLSDRWQRTYYIERQEGGTVDAGSTDISIGFNFAGTGIATDQSKVYYLLYRSGVTGEFSVVPGGTGTLNNDVVLFNISDANFSSGYYTIAKSSEEVRVWYSFNDGSWNSFNTWSLDPDSPINPGSEIPGIMDKIVIQKGKTVTVTNNSIGGGILEVNSGILDFGTTTNHSFSAISGQTNGTIRLAGDNFPAGEASGFADEATGGTVEYNGTGYDLTIPRAFRNMRINLTNATDQILLLADYNLNGSLTIERGELQLGNNVSTTPVNLTVQEHSEVNPNGKILTGTSNARHQLNLYGNFTNRGEVQFTNRTSANYTAEATNGIVDFNILSATRNQTIMLEGPSRFYRIAIQKGFSNTYEAYIEATDAAYFELLGFANQGHVDIAQLVSNTNALGLLTGTVRIGPNIVVPRLNEGGNYNISENAVLHVDGGTVTKLSGTAIVVYGKVIVSGRDDSGGTFSGGTLNANINSGITTRLNGTFESRDGGTTNLRQFRTSVYGSQHQGGYIQSGGTVNIVAGSIQSDYYKFCLTYPGNVFSMSGGTLHIKQTGGRGGVFINSDEVNQSVTGGTVICYISNANDFIITSKAPFWNLELRKTVANSNVFLLDEGVDVGGTNEYLAAQPLRVLRNFYIRGAETGSQGVDFYPVTDATNVNDVYIGGSFHIESGSQYWTAADGDRANNYNSVASLPTIYNTTYFNQTAGTPAIANLYWYNRGDVFDYDGNATNDADENMAEFGSFVLNRDSGNQLRVASSGDRNNNSLTIDVNGDLVVESGTLCQGRFTIRTWASVTNNDRLGTYYTSGPYPTVSGTPNRAQIRFRESEDSAPIINSTEDAIFGNTRFNVSPNSPFEFQNNMYFERLEYMRGILYLGSYNMKVDDLWNLNNNNNTDTDFFIESANTSSYLRVADVGRSTGTSSNQRIMIITDGKASDGGLSLKVSANSLDDNGNRIRNNLSLLTFPLGFSTDGFSTGLTNTYYRPAQMKVKDFSDDGYVTIRTVSGVLQTTNPAGGEILQHHWRVNHSDFTVLPTVAFRFYYKNRSDAGVVDLPAGASNESSYVPGKVLNEGTYQRAYESNDPAQQDVDGVFNAPVDANTRVIVFNGDNTVAADDDLFGFSANAPGITLESAKYTTGVYQRFDGDIKIFYSRLANGYSENKYWDDVNYWSNESFTGAAASRVPTAGDIVYMGYGGGSSADNHHYIKVRSGGTAECAELIFVKNPNAGQRNARVGVSEGSTTNPTTANFSVVSGEGEFNVFMRTGRTTILTGDFGDFAKNTNSTWMYKSQNNATHTIPSSFPHEYPNLSTEMAGTFVFPFDVTVNGNLNASGHNVLQFNDGEFGDFLIKGDMKVGGYLTGKIKFPAGGSSRRVNVLGDILVGWVHELNYPVNSDCEISVIAGGSDNTEHRLVVEGDINIIGGNRATKDGIFNLYSNNSGGANVILELSGNNNKEFIKNSAIARIPSLYKIVSNKGTAQSPTFTFTTNFTLNGPTNGTTDEKALLLQNGKLNLNNADIDINLSTGGEDFYIPSTSGLVVQTGRVNLSGANNGILLDGLLRVENGGTINLDGGAGVNNYIEYSASGKAAIEVTGGTLTVGSQIRRATTSADGILRYTQTGGNVVVGKNAAPVGNRGVFEVVNTGSRFIQIGGTLTVVRSQASATVASALIEPSIFSVGNATLQLGNDDTPLGSVITLKSSIELGNLIVAGANSPTARLMDRSLKLKRDLTIGAGSTFDGMDLNLTVKRHITNNGTANLNVDTLFLLGTSISPSAAMQNVTGNIRVKHLVVEPEMSVTLQASSGVEVDGDLFINSGQFIDGGNTITVGGNVTNNAAHESTNPNAGGILFNGSAVQRIYGNGQFGRLEVNNPTRVQLEGSMALNNHLTLTNGIFHLQHHGLTLGQNANVLGTGFNADKMIAVYGGAFTPQGLRKNLPILAGTNPTDPYNPADMAYTWDFTFPVGSDDGTNRRFLPMDLFVANNSGGGSVNVVPVNQTHITFSEPNQDQHVLNQYWEVTSSGVTQFTALQRHHYTQDAVLGAEEEYIGVRLYNAQWSKFLESDDPPIVVVDEDNNWINFVHTNVNLTSGDYTAGEPDWIPDQVPTFYSRQDGDWTDPNTWELNDGGIVPANGPVGQIAHIRTAHTVTISTNFRRAYQTTINGRLVLGTTLNHILGYVDGTGTLSTETSSVPTGDYTDFFGCDGGTMEYGGTGTYTLSDRYDHYNNLTITGSGTKTLPNADMTICGDLRIEGDVTLNNITDQNAVSSINLYRDVFRESSASFVRGYKKLVFLGNNDHIVYGGFEGSNSLWNIEFNTTGTTFINNGSVEVGNWIYLKDGIIAVEDSYEFTSLNPSRDSYPAKGKPTSYIDGKFKNAVSSSSPRFMPVGKNDKWKPVSFIDQSTGTYTSEYFDTNLGAGYYASENYDSPIELISGSEYWTLSGPNGDSAMLELSLTGTSDIAAVLGWANRESLRFVRWNNGTSKWEIIGGVPIISGSSIDNATIQTRTPIVFDGTDQHFTLASIQTITLPTAQFTSTNQDVCEGETVSLIVALTGTQPWAIEYSDGTSTYTGTNITSTPFSFDVTPSITTTYTLTKVTDDGGGGDGILFGNDITITVHANPSSYNVTSGGDICGGTTTTIHLDGSEIGFNYQLYRNNVYFGAELAGTGSALTFTGVDQEGTYTVRAFNSVNTNCFIWMAGSGIVSLGSAATAQVTSLVSAADMCEGDPVEIEITFDGTPPFTFTVEDNKGGRWADITVDVGALSGPGPYTYSFTIPNQFPTWTSPDIPNVFNYNVTAIIDDAGCGAGTVIGPGVNVNVYKIPETGPQYHIPNSFGE